VKGKRFIGSIVAAAVVLSLMGGLSMAQAPASSPLGTGFTYQGQLRSSDSPYSGACDFKFALWDALSGGLQVGSTLTKPNVSLAEGLFTVALDFGSGRFQGDARWLEVSVRCPAGSGTYTLLSPRQALTAAPAALSLALPFSAIGSSTGALVSVTNNGTGDGLSVQSAGGAGIYVPSAAYSGLSVSSAGHHGVWVGEATLNGLNVEHAGQDGVYVHEAGNPSASNPSTAQNGFEVAGAHGLGLYIGRADSDGVGIVSAGYDGLQIDSAGQVGVNVLSAGTKGVYVQNAGTDGVYANTTQADHEWGFYTPDKIYAGSALAGGGPSMVVAQAGERLEPGDLAAVAGLGAPFGESEFPAPLVRRAGPGTALAGVVYARFVAEERVEEFEIDGRVETSITFESHTAEGPVAAGDYLLLVVLGQAQVRAGALAGPIAAGDLLVAGAGGQATALGSAGYVPGSLIGTAMEGLDAAQGSRLIWVLVNPR